PAYVSIYAQTVHNRHTHSFPTRRSSDLAEAPFFEAGIQIEVPLGNRQRAAAARQARLTVAKERAVDVKSLVTHDVRAAFQRLNIDRKSTRLNSSHLGISYAVFCSIKKVARYRVAKLYFLYWQHCYHSTNITSAQISH